MAAPKHNENARKWTEASVSDQLAQIRQMARDPKKLFLGRVLAELGLHKNIWAYWQRKFANNEGIMYKMELIKDRFESNLYTAALKSEISAPFAIMCLKANYGWRENQATKEIRIADRGNVTDERQIEIMGYSRAA